MRLVWSCGVEDEEQRERLKEGYIEVVKQRRLELRSAPKWCFRPRALIMQISVVLVCAAILLYYMSEDDSGTHSGGPVLYGCQVWRWLRNVASVFVLCVVSDLLFNKCVGFLWALCCGRIFPLYYQTFMFFQWPGHIVSCAFVREYLRSFFIDLDADVESNLVILVDVALWSLLLLTLRDFIVNFIMYGIKFRELFVRYQANFRSLLLISLMSIADCDSGDSSATTTTTGTHGETTVNEDTKLKKDALNCGRPRINIPVSADVGSTVGSTFDKEVVIDVETAVKEAPTFASGLRARWREYKIIWDNVRRGLLMPIPEPDATALVVREAASQGRSGTGSKSTTPEVSQRLVKDASSRLRSENGRITDNDGKEELILEEKEPDVDTSVPAHILEKVAPTAEVIKEVASVDNVVLNNLTWSPNNPESADAARIALMMSRELGKRRVEPIKKRKALAKLANRVVAKFRRSRANRLAQAGGTSPLPSGSGSNLRKTGQLPGTQPVLFSKTVRDVAYSSSLITSAASRGRIGAENSDAAIDKIVGDDAAHPMQFRKGGLSVKVSLIGKKAFELSLRIWANLYDAKNKFDAYAQSQSHSPTPTIGLPEILQFLGNDTALTLEAFRLIALDVVNPNSSAKSSDRVQSEMTRNVRRRRIIRKEIEFEVYNLLLEEYNIKQLMYHSTGVHDVIKSVLTLVWAVTLLFVSLHLGGVNLNNAWISASAIVLSLSFAFGNSLKNLIESIVFVTVARPFDYGDRIHVNGSKPLYVRSIELMNTSFRSLTNEIYYIPNSELARAQIINMSRQTHTIFNLVYQVSCETTDSQLSLLVADVSAFVTALPRKWFPGLEFYVAKLEKRAMMEISLWVEHRRNLSTSVIIYEDHSDLLLHINHSLRKRGIRYEQPQLPVLLSSTNGVLGGHGGVMPFSPGRENENVKLPRQASGSESSTASRVPEVSGTADDVRAEADAAMGSLARAEADAAMGSLAYSRTFPTGTAFRGHPATAQEGDLLESFQFQKNDGGAVEPRRRQRGKKK